MTKLAPAIRRLAEGGAVTLCRAPEGYDAFVVADLTRALAGAGEARAVTLCLRRPRQHARAEFHRRALVCRARDRGALPALVGLPALRPRLAQRRGVGRAYDGARAARRSGAVERPRILVGSVSALTQRVPPLKYVASAAFSAAPGNSVRMDDLALWLETNGYGRTSTVRDVGDYATRGGILDLYPPGAEAPIRLDFFGDTLESIRVFDPETQRSVGQLRSLDLVPMSEARLTSEAIPRFRQGYAAEFGAPSRRRTLFRRQRGPSRDRPRALAAASLRSPRHAVRLCRRRALRARRARRRGREPAHRASFRFYAARRAVYAQDPARADYKPLPPSRLYLTEDEWKERRQARRWRA